MDANRPPNGPASPQIVFTQMPTGLKVFGLLSLALLPLALIAFLSAIQSLTQSGEERDTLHRVTVEDSARRLGGRLATDIAGLAAAADVGASPDECARTRLLLDAGVGADSFALLRQSAAGTVRVLCGAAPFQRIARGRLPGDGSVMAWIDEPTGRLLVAVGGEASVAIAGYPAAAAAAVVRPSTDPSPDYAIVLVQNGVRVPLIDEIGAGRLPRRGRFSAVVPGVPGVSLELTAVTPPLSADTVLVMLLPFVMWLAAAGIGWLVVDRLLLRPLYMLRRSVAGYRPGTVLDPLDRIPGPAREIKELGDTFHQITRIVANHDHEIEQGLARQTRLTREVHHRVKNNLQVVSSLINVHKRGAASLDEARAYATIQRRVDALAVVFRHHYADGEIAKGIALRPLISELASNLKGNPPDDAGGARILVSVPAFAVVQDIAVPIAFLVTELVEDAMIRAPTADISIGVWPDEGNARAELSIISPAFVDSADGPEMAPRHARVLDGLSRQLRTPLVRDAVAGRYSIGFSIVQEKN